MINIHENKRRQFTHLKSIVRLRDSPAEITVYLVLWSLFNLVSTKIIQCPLTVTGNFLARKDIEYCLHTCYNTLQELQKFRTAFKIAENYVYQKFWLLKQIQQMSDQFLSELYQSLSIGLNWFGSVGGE